MAGDDDYDLIPHSELKKLKKGISDIKGGDSNTSGMQDSMAMLSESLNSMISIFSEAKKELQIEDEEKELLSNKIDPMLQKIEGLNDQNEKIAEGILSLADMIKKLEDKIDAVVESQGNIVNVVKEIPETDTSSQGLMQPQSFGEQRLQGVGTPSGTGIPGIQQPGGMSAPSGIGAPGIQQPGGMSASGQGTSTDLLGDPFAPPASTVSESSTQVPDGISAPPGTGIPNIQQPGQLDSGSMANMPPQKMGAPSGMGVPPPPPPPKKKGFFGS